MDFNSTSAMIMPATELDKIQSPVFLGLTALVAGLFSFVAYLSHKPTVHYKSPAFASDMVPIFGAMSFTFRPW
jgi:uncharacterized membrane protein HdeD (DUF308 family)